MMRTLAWEGIELGNFILIASIHLWNQSIKNFVIAFRVWFRNLAFKQTTRSSMALLSVKANTYVTGERSVPRCEFWWWLITFTWNLIQTSFIIQATLKYEFELPVDVS